MTPNIITPKVKPIEDDNSSFYPYLLAVSSDSLYVISPDKKMIIEIIVEGKDNNGCLCAADSEDDFLDAILLIKKDILAGLNPLCWIL